MALLSALEITEYVGTVLPSLYRKGAAGYDGELLAPRFPVKNPEGLFVETNDTWQPIVDDGRAPGALPGEGSTDYKKGVEYATTERTQAEKVTDEELERAQTKFGFDVLADKVSILTERLFAAREARVTALFTSVSVDERIHSDLGYYNSFANQVTTLVGGQKWNQLGSDPFGDIETAQQWYSDNSPTTPSHLVMTESAARALSYHAGFRSQVGQYADLLDQDVTKRPTIKGLTPIIATAKYKNILGTGNPYFFGNNVWIGRLGAAAAQFDGFACQPVFTAKPPYARAYPDPHPGRKLNWVEVSFGADDIIVPRIGGSLSGYLLRGVLA